LRIEAFATVDEANSFIGVAYIYAEHRDTRRVLKKVQNDLFDVGADLCTPVVQNDTKTRLRVTEGQIKYLEQRIDMVNKRLQPLNSFVLPGGMAGAAHLHVARAVVRRAERMVWAAIEEHGEGVSILTAQYLNRLSDLLFVLARHDNRNYGDTLWNPGENIK
jgi:cob(I)alamin adenosyltransferase